MEKPLKLNIFYTSNIRGDIHMLPRLHTFINKLKPDTRQGTLLFDLGNSCADDVWHCEVTKGRSSLIVLDAMGFHAANVHGKLDPTNYEKTADVVTMGLVDGAHHWAYHIPPIQIDNIQTIVTPQPTKQGLQICLTPSDTTRIQDNILYLSDVSAGDVGQVEVDISDTPQIINQTTHTLPPNTPPNPTIVASVEFVESEARYFQKKQSGTI